MGDLKFSCFQTALIRKQFSKPWKINGLFNIPAECDLFRLHSVNVAEKLDLQLLLYDQENFCFEYFDKFCNEYYKCNLCRFTGQVIAVYKML